MGGETAIRASLEVMLGQLSLEIHTPKYEFPTNRGRLHASPMTYRTLVVVNSPSDLMLMYKLVHFPGLIFRYKPLTSPSWLCGVTLYAALSKVGYNITTSFVLF